MPDPSTIPSILQFVGVAAKAVCEALDKALDEAIQHEHEERYPEGPPQGGRPPKVRYISIQSPPECYGERYWS